MCLIRIFGAVGVDPKGSAVRDRAGPTAVDSEEPGDDDESIINQPCNGCQAGKFQRLLSKVQSLQSPVTPV